MRNVLIGALRSLRTMWLILGITLVLIALIEFGYRGQASIRRALAGPVIAPLVPEPPSPFEQTEWAADYWVGHEAEEAVRWEPYVYLRNPTFKAPFATVDSLGHRVTPQRTSLGVRPVRIFFLGGSTTFGWYQRAEYTIPAEAARRLQAELGENVSVEVTNFGVPGQTFTQEIIRLQLELRAGNRPDVVLFYDGINDVMATVQNGRAGLPQNEENRAEDFRRGRSEAAEARPGFVNALKAVGRVAVTALRRLEVVQRVLAVRQPDAATPVPTDSLASSSVRVFAANARLVEALAAGYGFQSIYVWQPALLSSRKPLTAREQWLRRKSRIADLHVAIPPLIGPAMSAVVGDRFIDATGLFDRDSLDVFVDEFGHTYERANPRIVDTLLPTLKAAVRRAGQRTRARGAP